MLFLNGLPETLHWIKYTDTVSNACNTCIYGHPTLTLLVITYTNFSHEGTDNIYSKCTILTKQKLVQLLTAIKFEVKQVLVYVI